jgi:hypothetical protein
MRRTRRLKKQPGDGPTEHRLTSGSVGPVYDARRAFRSPFVAVHEFGFYALAVVIVLHIIAVVVTEVHEGGSITSAMFTGRKILSRRPPDAP